MKKEFYAAPEFRFQELFLFEGIADRCWKFKEANIYVFYDRDKDNTLDEGETVIYHNQFTTNNGCAFITKDIEAAMDNGVVKKAFIDKGFERFYNDSILGTIKDHENAGDTNSAYFPIHS